MSRSLLVLGSGQDGGSPQVGSHRAHATERTASCVAIIGDDDHSVLLDASPDLRRQYQRLAHHLGSTPRLDGVGITHGHMGHYVGLVHFGKESAAADHLELFAPRSVIRFLRSNEPWATLFNDGNLFAVPMDEDAISMAGFTIAAIPVPHRAEFTTTVAYSVSVAGFPWMLYLPDIDDWSEWPQAEETIAAHEVVLIDATFSSINELPGRDMARIRHPLVTDTISRFSHLTRGRTIVLTHINHSNRLGEIDDPVSSAALERGFVIAHDGLLIDHV